MAGLKLHVQMFLHAKGDKSNEGVFRPDELLHRVQQSVSRYDKNWLLFVIATCSWSPKAEMHCNASTLLTRAIFCATADMQCVPGR
jgi:hypothetical protein